MKSVIKSLRPEVCMRIANGEQSIIVAKSAPKEVPFKAYIYETKAGFIEAVRGTCPKCAFSRGKIIGEFVCDKVDQIIEATAGICFTVYARTATLGTSPRQNCLISRESCRSSVLLAPRCRGAMWSKLRSRQTDLYKQLLVATQE